MASKEVDAFTPQITADMCSYWSNVSKVIDVTGCKMFPHLSSLAKASLTILHGNVTVMTSRIGRQHDVAVSAYSPVSDQPLIMKDWNLEAFLRRCERLHYCDDIICFYH